MSLPAGIFSAHLVTYAQIWCKGFPIWPGSVSAERHQHPDAKSLKNIALIICLIFNQPNDPLAMPRAYGLRTGLSTKLSTESVGNNKTLMKQGFSALSADSHP